jgi:hypothetical protein
VKHNNSGSAAAKAVNGLTVIFFSEGLFGTVNGDHLLRECEVGI